MVRSTRNQDPARWLRAWARNVDFRRRFAAVLTLVAFVAGMIGLPADCEVNRGDSTGLATSKPAAES